MPRISHRRGGLITSTGMTYIHFIYVVFLIHSKLRPNVFAFFSEGYYGTCSPLKVITQYVNICTENKCYMLLHTELFNLSPARHE